MSRRVDVRLGADGVWYARPYLGLDADGRQVRPYKRFSEAATREEAQALCDTWAANLTADGRVRSARLADLLNGYADMCEANGLSPNTVRSYRLFANSYVRRFLKNANARDLTAVDFQRFEQRLLKEGGRDGGGLSRVTVLSVHWFLQGAYRHFVRAGVCDANPLLSVTKPKPERREAVSVDEVGFQTLRRALEGALEGAGEPGGYEEAAYAMAAWLSLVTGMRCGEVCAVRRRDLRRIYREISVGGTVIEQRGLKPYRQETTKGRRHRNVGVTSRDIARIDAFLEHQDAAIGRQHADAPIVTFDGSFARPTDVSRRFSRLRDDLRLPKRLTFHGLRHTHATWCLASGVDLKTLSERLGHADVSTTLRVYAHVMPGRDAAAAEAFARAADAVSGGVANQ